MHPFPFTIQLLRWSVFRKHTPSQRYIVFKLANLPCLWSPCRATHSHHIQPSILSLPITPHRLNTLLRKPFYHLTTKSPTADTHIPKFNNNTLELPESQTFRPEMDCLIPTSNTSLARKNLKLLLSSNNSDSQTHLSHSSLSPFHPDIH